MSNQEIANVLNEIAYLQEMLGIAWKPIAFHRAARVIEGLSENIEELYNSKGLTGLTELPSIGEGIAKKIVQFIETGKIDDREELLKKIPESVLALLNINGLGPKKVAVLFKKLNIQSVNQLEQAAKQGMIQKLEGFGMKSEKEILKGISLLKQGAEHMLLGQALPIARSIAASLRKVKGVVCVNIVGSLRRMKESVKDIDILVIAKQPEKVMQEFVTLSDVQDIIVKGKAKTSVRLLQGLNADLRVFAQKEYGSAMIYFTGSKDHNVSLRQIAISKELKLNEYGLFKNKKLVAGYSEKELYNALKLDWIAPELREWPNAIELAKAHKLPDIISYNAILGDCHMHTTWSDGVNSAEEMLQACIDRGYEYIAITDHSKANTTGNGLDEKRLVKYLAEVDGLQKKYPAIHILKGAEIDILSSGALDYSPKILKLLDWRIGAIHLGLKNPKDIMTKRMLTAINSGWLHALAHPSGRLINEREASEFDADLVFSAAQKSGVVLEVNANYHRLDLKDNHVKLALKHDCKLIINTDSHSLNNLEFMQLGIGQARRGGATANDVLNTLSWKRFEKFVNSR